MTDYSDPLTWDELATMYDLANSGRRARTLPMNDAFEWASKQTDRFYVCPDEGTIHLRTSDD